MKVLKVNLYDDDNGLYAALVEGFNSVTQNNRAKNVVEVAPVGFRLMAGQTMHVAYAQSTNEDDLTSETLDYAIMAPTSDGTYIQEIPP